MSYVIIRSRDSGVHAGELVRRDGSEVELKNARRIWYWSGAATLSQLSQDGPGKPNACKFPAAVPSIIVLGVCEILPCSDVARQKIEEVKPWAE